MATETHAPGGAAGAAGAAEPERPRVVTSPRDEAAAAIEQTRQLLADAAAAVATGSDEQVARAFELAASSADQVARALWFLRRMEREAPAR